MSTKKKSAPKRPARRKSVKPSRLNLLIDATVQDHTHLATSEIVRKRTLLTLDQDLRDVRIAELRSTLSDEIRKKNEVDAVIYGLGVTVNLRRACN